MKNIVLKHKRFTQRKGRVRAKITGTAVRPRLAVHRSVKHISCQLIDDMAGKTLAASSDVKVKVTGSKTTKAQAIGTDIAEQAKKLSITTVVFDRSGYRYHGRIKELADSARKAGLVF